MSNMREISVEECNAVFGGIIIVNGFPPSTPPNPGPDNSAMQGAWMYLGMNSSSINYTSLYGQGRTLSENSGIGVTGEWNPDGDDDNDDISNQDEEIVVTATPMTPEQSAAYNYHRDVATWTVNAIYYGLLAKTAASGWAGMAGAAAAVATQAISDAREDMIDKNAHLNYLRDGADGRYDGRIDPRYITGEKVLPR